MAITRINKFNQRVESLKTDRSYMMPYWGELADYHLAHRGRFLIDKKGPPKRNTKQYNNTSRMAGRTLASGMMAGITSPARPWFKLSTSDPELNEYAAVKDWLHRVEVIMYRVFAKSNCYNSLHNLYGELGVFGTACMGVFMDYDTIIRCKTYTAGSYMLGLGGNDRVDTFARRYQSTVVEIVGDFGIDMVSNSIKNHWEQGNLNAEVELVHLIEPNDNRHKISPLARDMEYRSVYYEISQVSGTEDKFLRESGFNDFPILAPRWDVVDGEIYSEDCPGMVALGDTKALQLGEKRKYQALDKLSNPPLQGPSGLKSQLRGGTPNPGEIVWTSENQGELKSIYGNYAPRLDYIQSVQNETEMRIKRAFYEDLFLMLAGTDRRQITAREVAEKHEEKLLMLGPVLERLHAELLNPLIDRTFNILQENGVLPAAPPELTDVELKVEYVSVMAQAQRLVGVSAIERTIGFAANMVQVWPDARHKIDHMQAIDEYAASVGVNPRMVRPDEETDKIVQAEREAMQQQKEQQESQQMAEAAKTASQADTSGQNMLTDIMRNAGSGL